MLVQGISAWHLCTLEQKNDLVLKDFQAVA